MFRTLTITGITAIALAAAPIMAPQAAARSNLDNFMIGATALAVIGAIASNNNKQQQVVTKQYVAPPRYTHHYGQRNNVVQKKVIITRTAKPKHCLRKRWSHGGWVTYYGKKCVANHTTKTTRVYNYR